MKKLFSIGIIIFLLTVLVVFAASLTTSSDPVVIQGQQGVSSASTFTITNPSANPNITLSAASFIFDATKFKDNDGDIASISFSNPSPALILPGSSASVTVTAAISSKLDQGTYSAPVTISSGAYSNNFTLSLVVNPDVCDSGITGGLRFSDWELKKNPETDKKDEYYVGDKIVVQSIHVENNGNDEITDIIVRASLYDLTTGDEVDSTKSSTFNLKSGKDTSVDDLELTVPSDSDQSDDYAVYVKVYEDGNEEHNCNFESMPVTVKKRSRDMSIDLTSIAPQNAKCGDYVDFSVNVKNTGSKDDSSVYVKIQDPSLKILGQSAVFSLDSDDETSKAIRIQLPKDLTTNVYSIESVVLYSGTTPRSDFGNLTVTCEEENRAPVANAGATQTVDANSVVTLNGASSSDADNNQLTYLWTQTSGLAVQLSSPTSAVTTFTPTNPDTYVFKLDVNDGKVTSSAITTVIVRPAATGPTTYQPSSIFDVLFKQDSLQKGAWMMAILVLLLIALYLIKLIFFPGKKKPQQQVVIPKPEFPE